MNLDDGDAGPRVRRIPPPPPPGFGDEEYYQLYGRPEDYHRYRQHIEEQRLYRSEVGRVSATDRLQWTPADPPHLPRYGRQ